MKIFHYAVTLFLKTLMCLMDVICSIVQTLTLGFVCIDVLHNIAYRWHSRYSQVHSTPLPTVYVWEHITFIG